MYNNVCIVCSKLTLFVLESFNFLLINFTGIEKHWYYNHQSYNSANRRLTDIISHLKVNFPICDSKEFLYVYTLYLL